MKLRFHECDAHAGWECQLQLSENDPFGKRVITLTSEESIPPSSELDEFADEFQLRYRDIWPSIRNLLLDWGWSWTELKEAHQNSRIDIEDGSRFPPLNWDLTYDFLFKNGNSLELALSFEEWQADDKLVGCH